MNGKSNECFFATTFGKFKPKKNVTTGARTCPNNNNNIFTLCPTGDGVSRMWKNVQTDTFYNLHTKVEAGK